jgi:hypothetical protein
MKSEIFELSIKGQTEQQREQVANALNSLQSVFSPEEIIRLSSRLTKPGAKDTILKYEKFL